MWPCSKGLVSLFECIDGLGQGGHGGERVYQGHGGMAFEEEEYIGGITMFMKSFSIECGVVQKSGIFTSAYEWRITSLSANR